MQQEQLFHEDIYDAIKTAVMALGGAKKVGSELWPKLRVDKAGEKLNNCLNPLRPEKLDLEEYLHIRKKAREIGCHAIAEFVSQETGYKSEPIEPEDEKAKLQRQFVQAQKQMQLIVNQMERLNA